MLVLAGRVITRLIAAPTAKRSLAWPFGLLTLSIPAMLASVIRQVLSRPVENWATLAG